MTFKDNKIAKLVLHPLSIFSISTIANHLVIARILELDSDSMLFLAILNGISYDLLLPVTITLIAATSFVNKTDFIKKAALISIYCLACLPIIDYLYFSVTYSRFNWSILHDINIYSTKAMLGAAGLVGILAVTISFLCIVTIALKSFRIYTSYNFSKHGKWYKNLLYLAFLIVIFFPVEHYQASSNFSPVILPVMTKNLYLDTLGSGAIYGFLADKISSTKSQHNFTEYTDQERYYLTELGFLPTKPALINDSDPDRNYSKIVILAFESLALEYLNTYNKKIPPSASDYFDFLFENYPHCNNFYTTDSPTINGINALLNSSIPYETSYYSVTPPLGLVRLFKQKYGGTATFIRGVSKFYSGENLLLKSMFDFDKIIAYEDLALKYPKPEKFLWGFTDDVVLEETLNVMRANKDKPCFIFTKLIDQHQPPFYCGIPNDKLPLEIANHPSPIVASVYWANHLLRKFVETCQSEELIDKNTLLIITADHFPPLGYGHQDLFDKPQLFPLGKLPLIFITQNKRAFSELNTEKICCQLDLAPTICYLAKLQQPSTFKGNNILQANSPNRMIGHFNGNIFWKNEKGDFRARLGQTDYPDPAIQKWLNNLLAVEAE